MTKDKFLSETVENYLKAIYHLCQEDKGASTQKIAQHLGISSPGVTKMLHCLTKRRLIYHTRYQPVTLTPGGEKIALELIRHHRLIELYLTESLGYGWERVHQEAEKMEHHISEEFEDSIERLLGFPQFDPHGDPIPTRDGKLPEPVMETLASQPDAASVIVRRVTDENPALLLYLKDRRLLPGTEVQIREREPFGGSLIEAVAGEEQRISLEAAQNVFVSPVLNLHTGTELTGKEEAQC
ncbi:MAG: metal-dependent transcriptional regulator [Armatimonadota bacterium]|nr:metal-dependent transcriptional regulator [Armatimonadota bacterium]